MSQISLIIPTYNEANNIKKIITSIRSLDLNDYNIIFVDDYSPDKTYDIISSYAEQDERIRLILRPTRQGLSSAIFDGLFSSTSKYLVVMDADLQHDITLIPRMIHDLSSLGVDVVIASRKSVDRNSGLGFDNSMRKNISQFGTVFANYILQNKVTDPMSGFFAIRRDLLLENMTSVNPVGYKALLDILFCCKNAKVHELFYSFKPREFGESKLNFRVGWDFVCQLLSYFVCSIVPPQFISFMLVGFIGLTIHFFVYFCSYFLFDSFQISHVLAVIVATVFNFFLNNTLTFRLHNLVGWKLLSGLIIYFFAGSVGLMLNVSIAFLLYQKFALYGIIATLAGVAVDVVWKYTISSHIVWKS